jgi:basic membrane protein A
MAITIGSIFASGAKEKEVEATGASKLNVTLLVTGSFGDKAFNDSALSGVKKIQAELSDEVNINTIEMGRDKSKFESALLDAAESDSEVIITGLWEMKEIVETVALDFPDKKFIVYDTAVSYADADYSNVYSMTYLQNQAGFLAGVLAASTTSSNIEYTLGDSATIGFIGAKENSAVINDIAIGFVEGAKYVNPNIKVLISYVGSYVDSATCKELALTQYSNGADIVFVAAGPSSVGAIEAAFDTSHFIIGVDSDQAAAYEDQNKAKFILSSAIKNVGESVYRAVSKTLDGTLSYGEAEVLGINQKTVGLAINSIYNSTTNDEIKNNVAKATKALAAGEITVNTAYGMDFDKVKEIIYSAK